MTDNNPYASGERGNQNQQGAGNPHAQDPFLGDPLGGQGGASYWDFQNPNNPMAEEDPDMYSQNYRQNVPGFDASTAYGQPVGGQQQNAPGYAQPGFNQNPGFNQAQSYGQPSGYGQMPGFSQNPGFGQMQSQGANIMPSMAYDPTLLGKPKSKVVAALLAFFLGSYGGHNFYLGYTRRATIQLVMTLMGYLTAIILIGVPVIFAVAIWAFVEFIMILVGSSGYDVDARGVPLDD